MSEIDQAASYFYTPSGLIRVPASKTANTPESDSEEEPDPQPENAQKKETSENPKKPKFQNRSYINLLTDLTARNMPITYGLTTNNELPIANKPGILQKRKPQANG